MSRCFPYPPPGYTLSKTGKDALIESIKLQKESEKAKDKERRKQEKKDKKREGKERKKEKKEKEKKDKAHQKLDKSGIVYGQVGEKLWTATTAGRLHKQCEAESVQVERSSLTEEHGPPICSHAPSSSSDSTENSNKRKRQCSSTDENGFHGKMIRIRLSKKQNDSNALTNQQQPCSTSRVSLPSQRKDDISLMNGREGSCSTSNETSKINQGLAFRSGGEQICSTSLQNKAVIAKGKVGISGTPPIKNAVVTPMQRVELQYKNLFENWVPPQMQDASINPDGKDWLFQSKNKVAQTETSQIFGSDSSMSGSGNQTFLWPCARHLPELDIYALPFTVPL